MRELTEKEFKKVNALMFQTALKVNEDEELAKEALSRVWLKYAEGTFNKYKEAELLPILRKATRNQVLDIVGSKYYKMCNEASVISLEFLTGDYSIEKESINDRQKDTELNNLHSELDKLKPKETKLIQMKYIDGMSYDEIVSVLGGNEKSLCVKAGRILKKIKLKMCA